MITKAIHLDIIASHDVFVYFVYIWTMVTALEWDLLVGIYSQLKNCVLFHWIKIVQIRGSAKPNTLLLNFSISMGIILYQFYCLYRNANNLKRSSINI